MSRTVLFVMTGSNHWTLDDGTKHPTGFWAEEAVAPLEIFKDAGYDVTVATPGGVRPPVDEGSLTAESAGSADAADHYRSVVESAVEFQKPIALSDVVIDDYDAVFVPGGHGPMEDLAVDPEAGKVLSGANGADRPLAIVCHGPAALLAATDGDGKNTFAGHTVTGFTNTEEEQAGLADKAPWLLQDRLTEAGLNVVAEEPWAPHIETDRNLLTGQNPASSGPLARALVDRLGKAD
ncbi:type 1 glutamine amidotransferase domain-containing protein [Gordonia sp. SID5947]|uniref:type 1 glutamine amidotransferase domain-containing protein n=1 Tax=Gordonia sp. SID5947 TaxID=2690315 RepID=UPI001369C4E4|nr:type 1 glutamine amidotransferase domain-containing protein [Gordonia sp. SID5947]MYR08273.1 type 1 glutamine amidotransferase domain-containing protein [Gordonia sp. SID5947]